MPRQESEREKRQKSPTSLRRTHHAKALNEIVAPPCTVSAVNYLWICVEELSWKRLRGELADRRAALWVAAQLALLASYALIPRWSPLPVENLPPVTTVAMKTVAVAAMAGALFYGGRGLGDLGSSLTPLPTPRSVCAPVYEEIAHGGEGIGLTRGSR